MASSSARPLEGKLAIVTGAFRGIGLAITEHLAAKGANILGVCVSDSTRKKSEEIVQKLQAAHGVRVVSVQTDLNDAVQAPADIIAAAKKEFGGDKLVIDILINNAAVPGDWKLVDVPIDQFHTMYNVNVLGPLVVTQAVVPYLPHDRSGRIVNISSVASSMGFQMHTLYGGTKAALEAMTRTWSRELAERATVNAVNPGPVESDMFFNAPEDFRKQLTPFQQNTPLSAVRRNMDDAKLVQWSDEKMAGRRPAYLAEIAGIVGMICGPDSAWCTGSVICANGGFRFST